MKTYRTGFLLALIGNVVLAAVLFGLWLHYRAVKPMADSETKNASSPAQDSMANSMATPPASTEAPLVPVQISPQRLQSTGVRTGKVERKLVADEIRTTGSVAADERRLAYVQVRFSGYIQKVFVDATYQYVRKGQPLFTVYSPELVVTEREYLVAKQNQQQVAQSTVQGVAFSAASLLDAAAERLKQWGVPQKKSPGSNAPARCNRNWKSIRRSPATSQSAMLYPALPFSRKCASTPSRIFPPFGFRRRSSRTASNV